MEKLLKIVEEFYEGKMQPAIQDLEVLDESPDGAVTCIRWKAPGGVITVKAIRTSSDVVITQLR